MNPNEPRGKHLLVGAIALALVLMGFIACDYEALRNNSYENTTRLDSLERADVSDTLIDYSTGDTIIINTRIDKRPGKKKQR